jgi:F0F1-type ATP synthase beta subunit
MLYLQLTGSTNPAYAGHNMSSLLDYWTSYGHVCRVAESFVDVKFNTNLPLVLTALDVCGHSTQLEVAQHLGDGVMRTLTMSPTHDITKGSLVHNSRRSIMVINLIKLTS